MLPNDIVRTDDGRRAIDDVRTSLSSGQNVRTHRPRQGKTLRCDTRFLQMSPYRKLHGVAPNPELLPQYALKTRATYGSRAHTRGRALALYVSIYLSIYRRVMTRQSVIEGHPRPTVFLARRARSGRVFFEKGRGDRGGGRRGRTNGRTRRSIGWVGEWSGAWSVDRRVPSLARHTRVGAARRSVGVVVGRWR